MNENIPEPSDRANSDPDQPSRWVAAEVMRLRAEEARTARDDAISQLRASMTDDQILDEFGIDLGEIEK